MNYIKLMNTAFKTFYFDDRLNPTHISLYMALFQEWNNNRFRNEFYVSRQDMMKASKIGSKSTYHRTVRDLDAWSYLVYYPSNNPFKGSKIKMIDLDFNSQEVSNSYDPKLEQLAERYRPKGDPPLGHQRPNNGQAVNLNRPRSEQALVSNTKNNKQENKIKQPKGWLAVLNFFEEKSFNTDEAQKFFEHYKTRNWQTSDGKAIRDWRSLAISWMDRAEFFEEHKHLNKEQASQIEDNLRTTKHKDYGQPL